MCLDRVVIIMVYNIVGYDLLELFPGASISQGSNHIVLVPDRLRVQEVNKCVQRDEGADKHISMALKIVTSPSVLMDGLISCCLFGFPFPGGKTMN